MLPANNQSTLHEIGKMRDADTFQTDRKPQDPKNGDLSVNAFHRKAKEL